MDRNNAYSGVNAFTPRCRHNVWDVALSTSRKTQLWSIWPQGDDLKVRDDEQGPDEVTVTEKVREEGGNTDCLDG